MSSHFPSENREDSVKNKIFHTQDLCLRTNLRCAKDSARMEIYMIKEDGLPVGLGFGLAMNEKALGQFSMMTEDEKRQVIDAARGAQTKEQIAQIVKDIADMEFF